MCQKFNAFVAGAPPCIPLWELSAPPVPYALQLDLRGLLSKGGQVRKRQHRRGGKGKGGGERGNGKGHTGTFFPTSEP